MTTKVHPTAAEALELILAGRSKDAEARVATALDKNPQNDDLWLAKAHLLVYAGREVEAVELLEKHSESTLTTSLSQLLTDHYYCRREAAEMDGERDVAATRMIDRIDAVCPVQVGSVGTTLTACLIVKNEEANLARCLASLKDVADEIVIVDTGSTDATVAIAEQYNATIGHFAWCDDFAAARNEALKLAHGHWILWIDADEELSSSTKSAMRKALVRPQFGGYAIEIVNFTEDGSDASTYVHAPIRLFRNLPGVEFEGRIHEQVAPSLAKLKLPWAYLDGAQIYHYGYRPEQMEAKGKLDRTIALLEREVRESPNDAFQWFNLANAYTAAERWAETEHAARMCNRVTDQEGVPHALNYQLLANALTMQNKLSAALGVCTEAEAKGFGGILNEFERANALLKIGALDDALASIDRCIKSEWKADSPGDYGIYSYKRFIVRGQILALLGRYKEAQEMFSVALDVHPSYGPALYSQAATLEKTGDVTGALATFLKGREDLSVRQLCTKGAARASLALGHAQEASTYYQEAWESEPEDTECWVGWAEAANAWGDVATIVNAYEAFCKTHTPTADILINWGRALQASGQVDRAMTCFTEAIMRDATNANAYFNCGDLLYQMGQYHDAAHLYESGLRHAPLNAEGWFVLGNSLAQLDLHEAARTAYNQALAINPRHSSAKHNLEVIAEAA